MSSDLSALKERLAQILMEKSYLEGNFTLTSGKKSDYYFDCRQSSLHPEGAFLIGSIFFSMLQDMQVKAVAGMTMGGDPLVTATSLAAFHNNHFLPALIVRKEPKGHGTSSAVEGLGNVKKGDSIILLEDVVNTGGSVLKACDFIKQAELNVAAIFCILNRAEDGGERLVSAGYPLYTIFTRQSLLQTAKKCT